LYQHEKHKRKGKKRTSRNNKYIHNYARENWKKKAFVVFACIFFVIVELPCMQSIACIFFCPKNLNLVELPFD
jgi:hypothetical protein